MDTITEIFKEKKLKLTFSCLVGGDICDKITKELYKIVKKYNLKQVKYGFCFKIFILKQPLEVR